MFLYIPYVGYSLLPYIHIVPFFKYFNDAKIVSLIYIMNNLVQETISNCVQKAGNVQVIENILDDSEIESLMKNEIIIKNKLLVENDTNDYKSLSFSLPVDNVIIDKIKRQT